MNLRCDRDGRTAVEEGGPEGREEGIMKITMVWHRNKNTQKKKHFTRKPKIRWQQLGLKDPKAEDTSVSIDEIRRQVIQLSSQGFGQSVRSRPSVQGEQPSDANEHAEPSRKRHQGATE